MNIMFGKIGKKINNFLLRVDQSQASVLIFSEIIFGTLLSFMSVYVFVKFSENTLNNKYINFDINILNFFYSIRSPLLTKIMLFFSFLGYEPLIIITFFIVIILIRRRYVHEAILFASIIILEFAINDLLKHLIARNRPFIHPLIVLYSFSFPSGHSMNSFVFYSMLAFFAFRFTRKKMLSILIGIFCLTLVFLIGISRIYLGVHYPTDVFAGFVGGFCVFVTALVIEKTIIFFRLFRLSKNPRA